MKSPFVFLILLLSFQALASAAASSKAQEWPGFRGPTGQGVATALNPPVSWDTDKGVAWKTEIPGKGWSSPVVHDGKLVLTSAKDGEEGNFVLCVLLVDTSTGDILWEKDVFSPSEEVASVQHSKNSMASGTPIISEGVIYAHFAHMGTAALELSTGKVLWKQILPYDSTHGSGGSPVLVNGLLVFNTDGKEDPAVVALDAKTGELVWKTYRDHEVKRKFSFGTPLVIDNQGRTEIVSPGSGMVGAYAPEDGKLLWKVSYDQGFSIVPRPVHLDNMVYVMTGFSRPNLFAIRTDGATGDLTESHVEWQTFKGIPKTPSPILADGCIYVLDDTGGLSCLDAKTGEVFWKEKLIGNFSASPVLAGNRMYCCTEDGVCYVLEVSPKEGSIIWETDMAERILASPAVLDETLYIRSHPHLWKISKG